MRKLCFPLLLILLVSCGTQVNYLGTTYPSTKNVDVFVDQASVKKPFDVIGKGYIKRNIGPEVSVETIQRKAVEKAKINGANAVVIEFLSIVPSVLTPVDVYNFIIPAVDDVAVDADADPLTSCIE